MKSGRQHLPTELIGIVASYLDFTTHNVMRCTCSSVRLYVPQFVVVGFEEYQQLVELYNTILDDNLNRRVFQERVHLQLSLYKDSLSS